MDAVTLAAANAAAAKRYERTSYPRQAGAFTALANVLADGQHSAALAVLTDSTGGGNGAAGVGRFPRLAAANVGAAFPAYGVQALPWNEGLQAYDTYVQVQAPPLGARSLAFAGSTARHPGDGTALVDLDVQVRVSFNTWASGPGSVMVPVSRFGGAGQRGFECFVAANGAMSLAWTVDGTTTIFGAGSGVAPPATANTPIWLRWTLDVDNGASGYQLNYQYSTNERASWTTLATPPAGGAVTSLFNPTAFDYELGAANGGTTALAGKVYEVLATGTIGSQSSVVPRWVDHWEPQAGTVTLGGSPMLTLVQGGIPGAPITYLNDSVRCPKMTPRGLHTLAVVLGCSHNDQTRRGLAYLTDWDLWLSRVRANWPYASLAVTTQNPRTSPATSRGPHRIRQDDARMWAAKNNATLIDAYRAFLENPGGYAGLVQSDGIHPTVTDGVTDGAALWGRALSAAILARA